MKKLILVAMILLFAVFARAADQSIYIDSSASAGGDGSESTPYDAFSDINWTTGGANSIFDWVATGDDVYINVEGVIRDMLTCGTDGSSAHPITIKNYGPGSVISGAQVILNAFFTKTAGRTNVYETSFDLSGFGSNFLEPMVWEDDDRLSEQTGIADTDTNPGSFYYDSGNTKMYVHAANSSSVSTNDQIYEFPQDYSNMDFNGKDYIILDGVDCIKTSGNDTSTVGGIVIEGDHNIIRNLKTYDHRRHSLIFNQEAEDNEVYNVDIYDAYTSAAAVFYGTSLNSTTNNVLRDSRLWNGTANGVLYIHGLGGDSTFTTNNTIENCDIYRTAGYWTTPTDALATFKGDSNTLQACKIYGESKAYGLDLNGASGTKIIGNIIDAVDMIKNPIYIRTDSENSEIYHNLIKDGSATYYAVQFGSTGCKFKNNILSNQDRGIYVVAGMDTDFESDYNINHSDTMVNFGNWLGATKSTLALWRSASSQDSSSSIEDPLLKSDGRLQKTSPAIDTGTWIETVNMEGQTDTRGKKVHSIPNRGYDQGAGASTKSRFFRIGG